LTIEYVVLKPLSKLPGIFVLGLCYVLIGLAASGQDRYKLNRLEGPLNFDGVISDSAWERIEPLPIITFNPVYGQPPSEKTEIRLGYDDHYLYVGGYLYDSHPDKMKIQFKRDDWKYSID
jgi:hypothetical protein